MAASIPFAPPPVKSSSLREGLALVGSFLRYLRADRALVLGGILDSALLVLLRLPLLSRPAGLAAHLDSPGGLPPGELSWPGGAVLAFLRAHFGNPGYL